MTDPDCIFCKIANGDIPSTTVYEDDDFRVILDLNPAARGHALILPKAHFKDITQADEACLSRLLSLAAKTGAAMKEGLGADGFNIVVNTGACAGQTVFHLHVHIIPRYEGGPEMVAWKPGEATDEEREETAALIRAAL